MVDVEHLQAGKVELNDAELYYEVAGVGTPVVLVHAGIADRRMWDAQVPALAGHYQVIRYDLRGYGQSTSGKGKYSHAADLHGLLTALGIKSAYLIGCSKGGTAVLDLALEHPELVKGLILVASGPSGYMFKGAPPAQWDAMVTAFRAGDLDLASELEMQIWVDGPYRTPEQVDPQVRARVKEMNEIALKHSAEDMDRELAPKEPAVGRLGEIKVPTLIMYGDLDDPNIIEAGKLMLGAIPGAKKAMISGAAHLPSMEKPEVFNRIVLDFLADNP